jgi:hypothetical protein
MAENNIADCAVLTGDLINSGKIPSEQYDNLLYQLNQLLTKASTEQSRYSIFRGDAFQVLLSSPETAISDMLIIRLGLISHGWDARISAGFGAVSNPRADIKTATGEAFTLSGKGLDNMTSQQRLSINSSNQEYQFHMPLLLQFADTLVSQTSKRQACALYEYFTLTDNSHQAIALRLGSSRVNATKLLNQGHYQLLQEFVLHSQQLYKRCFHG